MQSPAATAKIRGRFAPSPSGRMHLGNLFAAFLAWLDVRQQNGVMIMRLEDLDPERSHKEYAQWLIDDLLWLGLDWDEGWRGQADDRYMQSKRDPFYQSAFQYLQQLQLIYPCYCSRNERQAALAPHPGEEQKSFFCRCRSLSRAEQEAAQRPPAWKIIAPQQTVSINDGHYGFYAQNLAAESGDFILRRSDGVFAYQLAVSVDDADMAVNRVVRARDLLPSALRQKWLISQLGATPPTYCHTPLLVAENSRKLSKRHGDLSMEFLRQRFKPQQIIGLLAYLAGLLPPGEQATARELVSAFSWQQVPKRDIVIDQTLLAAINAQKNRQTMNCTPKVRQYVILK